MSAPSPEALAELVRAAHKVLTSIEDRYQWLYAAGYEQRRGGHPGNGTEGLNDVARMLGVTGPARGKLERAGRQVAVALQAAMGADKALAELEGLIDAGADRTIVPIDVRRLRDVQRQEADANRSDGESARARRLARGERRPGDGGLPRVRAS